MPVNINNYRVAGQVMLKFSATFVLIISFVQIFIGLKAYLFTTNADIGFHFVGSFWVGAYFILPGLIGVLSHEKTLVLAGLITGFIGLAIAVAGKLST
jgi:heme/copper-type cytochrome/quinol oxidase subunit 4